MSTPDFSRKFQRRWPTRTPASTRGLQFVHRVQEPDIFAHAPVRAFADHKRQIGVAAVSDLVDRRPVGGDCADVSVLLPDGVGRALDDVDDDLVGIELADARLFDERIGLEPRLRLGHVEKRQRSARIDARDREDPGLAHVRRAGDRDHCDAKADRPGEPIAGMARLLHDPVELAASLGAQKRRAEENEERQRDIEPVRRGTVQPNAPAQRRPRRPFGAQQHLMRGRFGRNRAQRRSRRLSPSEHFAQPSHDPSSTIREPGISNEKAGLGRPLPQGRRRHRARPGVD